MNDLRESQCIALVEYAPSVVGDRFDLIFISEANRSPAMLDVVLP